MSQSFYRFSTFSSVPVIDVSITDTFWGLRIDTNRAVSLPLQYEQLNKSGVLDNFKKVINREQGNFNGLFFSDSDAYKWIEAVCHSLKVYKDSDLEVLLDEVIGLIIKTQETDGYINTYFQIMESDKKFSNFGVCHELYTGGHLILAGIAHHDLSGRSRLFDTACKFADLIYDIFGDGKFEAVDGHAGIEMALIELYRVTSNSKYFELAEFFINQRGNPNSRLKWELNHLDEIAGSPGKPGRNNTKKYGSYDNYDGRYAQDHLPVREQREAVGHAVRAMYLYCGMAELYFENGDPDLLTAMQSIWQNIVLKKMYITGGIGSSILNEGFTRDYDLSNKNACTETCAAYGMIIWSKRMHNITGNAMYADVIERILYNGFLVGVSLDGKKYSYNNPLKSNGGQHRDNWNDCACCPPNVARLLTTIGDYIYSQYGDTITVDQYIQSRVKLDLPDSSKTSLNMESNYPWDGKIKISFQMDKPSLFSLSLRIPGWCKKYNVEINNEKISCILKDGYITVKKVWNNSDIINLELFMDTVCMVSHPMVLENHGKVVIQRGPLVYCLEETDHSFPVEQIIIKDQSSFNITFMPDLLGGVNVIEGAGLIPKIDEWNYKLYNNKNECPGFAVIKFRAIPYYAWGNREPGSMVVWINSQ